METKSIFLSKTVWGAVIAASPAILALFGYRVSDSAAFTSGAEDVVNSVVTLVGAAVAVYGRLVATKNLVVRNR